jgi:hypothetical protein
MCLPTEASSEGGFGTALIIPLLNSNKEIKDNY